MNPSAETTAKRGVIGGLVRVRRALAWLGGIYLFIVFVMFVGQDRLAFTGWTFRNAWRGIPSGAAVDELAVKSSDGNTIQAWWLPPRDWTPGDGALIYMHGNGENLTTNAKYLVKWRDELHRGVVGFDYPGYGHSTGTPSEQGCYAASQAVFDWLIREKHVSPGNIVVVGQSLGGAMATEIASRQRCRLLVASSTFTSFPDVAQDQYFWLPARYLVHLQFDNLDKVKGMETPVFVTHGTADRTVPFPHGERLYAAAKEPKRFFPVMDHGHSQPNSEEFYKAVREFLKVTQRTLFVRPESQTLH